MWLGTVHIRDFVRSVRNQIRGHSQKLLLSKDRWIMKNAHKIL